MFVSTVGHPSLVGRTTLLRSSDHAFKYRWCFGPAVSEEGLLAEIGSLKKKVEALHEMLIAVMGSYVTVNERLSMLESLAMTTSKLAQVMSDTLQNHIQKAMEEQALPLLPTKPVKSSGVEVG